MKMLKDSFGRTFPYIRLSITDVCNFKCGYCLPNGYQKDKSDNRTFLTYEEIGRLAKGLSELGVCKIRLTGGEPTVRKDFFDIVKIIKSNSGIKKTVITTNGYRLDKIAGQIVDSGLDGINISIDSLNRETFKNVTGHDRLPEILKGIKKLQKDNYVYKGKLQPPKGELSKNWKTRDQLLFNSTKFGDDTDRALQKEDKTWTYFASDIAYHAHKINRNFDILVNILGSDHAGYIKRITSAVRAISKNKINLVCKVSQLVKLFKKGEPFKMSKRNGDYITVEDLIKEVGRDSVRFMMLNRSNDVELNFDFEKVTEKSKDNPVFYVQYAYARINSIFRALKLDIENDIKLVSEDFTLNQHEIEILKKISEWPRCVEISSFKLEPHRIPFYLYDLVTLFHSYWNLGKENKEFRFILQDNSFNNSRLLLLQALSMVIINGMSILGVSTPKSM